MPTIKLSKINPIEMEDSGNDSKKKPATDNKKKPARDNKTKPSVSESSESDESGRSPSPTIGTYEGERNELGERHGYGTAVLITPSGQEDVYQGYYQSNKRHGLGTYLFSNGARYVGDYVNNKKHGHGIFIYPDGSKYTGEWINDLREGNGTYTYPNGDTYEGEWKGHHRHGRGVYTYADSKAQYVGEWANGKLNGECQFVNPSYTFEGNFRKNVPIGGGKFTFSNSTNAIKYGKYLAVPDQNQIDQDQKPVIINKWFE